MPYEDDLEKDEFITDKINVGKQYQAHIIDVYREDDSDLFFVTFHLPQLNGIYKEKGKGLRVNLGGKNSEKKLAVQFLYNIGFPGKKVEPERISNVSGGPAKIFEIEKMENWLGLRCLLIFKEEPGFNDPEKKYKNIKREWNIKTDGIQPWGEGENLNVEQVKELQEKFLKQEDEYNPEGGNKDEEDLPF